MKIYAWLCNRMSATNGIAVVEVDAGEIADIEQMLFLVDGNIGHFGLSAELIATEGFDIDQLVKDLKKRITWKGQFGFSGARELIKKKRYYKVFVNRD